VLWQQQSLTHEEWVESGILLGAILNREKQDIASNHKTGVVNPSGPGLFEPTNWNVEFKGSTLMLAAHGDYYRQLVEDPVSATMDQKRLRLSRVLRDAKALLEEAGQQNDLERDALSVLIHNLMTDESVDRKP
jgi:hypothetical protein